jgi:hypothetical protein
VGPDRHVQRDTFAGNVEDPLTLHVYLYAGADPINLLIDEFGVYIHFQNDRSCLALHAQTVSGTGHPFLEWFEDED